MFSLTNEPFIDSSCNKLLVLRKQPSGNNNRFAISEYVYCIRVSVWLTVRHLRTSAMISRNPIRIALNQTKNKTRSQVENARNRQRRWWFPFYARSSAACDGNKDAAVMRLSLKSNALCLSVRVHAKAFSLIRWNALTALASWVSDEPT